MMVHAVSQGSGATSQRSKEPGMPQIKSAMKRMRTSAKRQAANRARRSRISTTRGRLLGAIEAGDRAKSEELYREYCSCLDKAVKRGAIAANNAGRRKSRAAAKMAATA
jgi:small subunit ribosomal protein S20